MSQNAGESSKCTENDSKSVSVTERINLFYDLMAEDNTTTEHIKGVRVYHKCPEDNISIMR